VAIGTGLITEVFGFASGLVGRIPQKLLERSLGLLFMVAALLTLAEAVF